MAFDRHDPPVNHTQLMPLGAAAGFRQCHLVWYRMVALPPHTCASDLIPHLRVTLLCGCVSVKRLRRSRQRRVSQQSAACVIESTLSKV